jgi:hypothetical protein
VTSRDFEDAQDGGGSRRPCLRAPFQAAPLIVGTASAAPATGPFSRILAKQSLSVTDFASKRALQEHLVAYQRAWNKKPTSFEWTKPARAIIKSHKRMLDRISTAVHLVACTH